MYYIVGKDSYDESGRFIDTNDMNLYWELGWEISTNHLLVKRWLKDGIIKKDKDIIVTRSGLEFMYNSVFDNVINFTEFKKIDRFKNHKDHYINKIKNGENDVVEVMPIGFSMRNNPVYYKNGNIKEKYIFYDEDKNIITDMNFIKDTKYLHNNKEYVCLNLRFRNFSTQLYRNVKDEYVLNLIDILSKKFDNIFVIGFNIDKFTSDKVREISFREYASLINNKLCKYVIGSLTGFNLLHQIISNANEVITVDFGNENFSILKNDIIGLGECVRYSPSKFKYFHYDENILNVMFDHDGEI